MDSAVDEVMALTRSFVARFGSRPSGSAVSREAADALKEMAERWADRAWTMDFEVHPRAFLGWIRLTVVLYATAVVLLWMQLYLPAAVLLTLGMAVVVGEFFLYAELIDLFYPKQTGRNVLAVVEPEGEVRGQLIVSGHHDSARVFNFFVNRPELYAVRVTGGLGGYVLFALVCWVLFGWQVATGSSPFWGQIAAGLFTLFFLLMGQLWWFAGDESTPGAGDNMASTAVVWQLLKQYGQQKNEGRGLRHLRLVFASWDAEEAGLRGARAWVKQGTDGLGLDLPTWNYNLECLYDENALTLLTTDVNGSVKLSEELGRRCQQILAGAGYEAALKPLAFLTGGTDAGELARGGAEATTLIGMSWDNATRNMAYHTPQDVPEAVSMSAVAAALRLGDGLAQELDEELAAGC